MPIHHSQIETVEVSGGAGDAGKIPRLNSSGQLDASVGGGGGSITPGDYRLDQFAAPNTSVSFGSQKITNLADPTTNQDAATKAYVDANAGGGGNAAWSALRTDSAWSSARTT